MAAFSPKDLISPMKKIEASLEEINSTTKELVEVVTGAYNPKSGTLSIIATEVETISRTLLNISKKLEIAAVVKKKKGDSEGPSDKLKNGVELFKTFGIGIKEFALGMVMFNFVPEKTATKLVNSIKSIAESLSEIDKQVFENATKLGEVGENIFKFTGWILLSSLLAVGALIAIPIIAAEIWLFSKMLGGKDMQERLDRAIGNTIRLGQVGWSLLAFEGLVVMAGLLAIPAMIALPIVWITVWGITKILETVTKHADDILLGTVLLSVMAVGLSIFSVGILLFGLATKTLDFGSIIMGAMVIGIIGLTCRLLGDPNVFPYVMLGAIALIAMSLPLLIFSTSLLIFALSMKLVDEEMPAKMMKLIINIGLAFAIVGMMSGMVLSGGIAMTAVSVSVMILGIGLLIWSLTLKVLSKNAARRISELVLGIGLAYASIGLLSVPILLGAAAIASAGASLLILGIGLLFMVLPLKLLSEEDDSHISSLIMTLGGTFAGLGILSVPIILGSAAVLTIGVSLLMLAPGLTMFGLALKVLGPEEEARISTLFGTLAGSFTIMGIASIPIALGAAATITAGVALLTIAPGLILFKKANWEIGDGDKLRDALTGIRNGFLGIKEGDGVVTIIKKTAAAIAGSAALLAVVPGFIAAGLALTSIAKGVTKIKELNWDTEKDGEKIKNVLESVSFAFAQVADKGEIQKTANYGGLFGKIFGGFTISKNKVKEGIDSVKGAGKALTDISEGMLNFSKWYSAHEKDIGATKDSKFFKALTAVLTTLGEAFATLGGDDNDTDTSGIFSIFKPKESKVQKGIESVKGLGKTIVDISEGLIKFTDWYNNNKDKIELKEGSEFYQALTTTLTSIAGAFATIGGSTDYIKKDAKGWGPFKWDDNLVEKGIESVNGIGEALNGMLDGVIKFTDFYTNNKTDLESTTFENIGGHSVPKGGLLGALYTTISAVGKAFASLGGEENEYSSFLFFEGNAVADGIEAVQDVDKALDKIVSGIQKFIDADIQQNQIDNITKLITSFSAFGKLAEVDVDDLGEDFDDFSKDFLKGINRIEKHKKATTHMKNVSVFMLTMERQVRFRTFNKAADGIKKIAEAVNSIDVEKGRSFSNLFVAASRLRDNSQFYEDLVEAIEDIRDLLAENGIGGKDQSGNTENGNRQTQQTQVQPQPAPANNTPSPKIDLSGKTIKANNITINVSESASITGLM